MTCKGRAGTQSTHWSFWKTSKIAIPDCFDWRW